MRPVARDPGELTIAQIAAEYGLTHRTVRFYEDRGLIRPERRGTRRVYHPRDRVRLGLILRGKRLGFSLEEITRIIDMYDEQPGEVGQLEFLMDQCDVRREQLERQRRDIDDTIAELEVVKARCLEDLAKLV